MNLLPTKKAGEVLRLIDGLNEDEVLCGSDGEEKLIRNWLTLPADGRCRCGAKMLKYESLNGCCWECSRVILARDEASRAQPSLLERLHVPPRYQACTREAWQGRLPQEVVEWAARPHDTLLISGPVGCGKTHLATIALGIAARAGRWGEWTSARTLARDLMADARTTERELWRRLTRRQVLLLDDLGGEPGVSWASDQIAGLLDERFAHNRALIVTTNLTPDALYASDARMASRLSVGVAYTLAGRDRRID